MYFIVLGALVSRIYFLILSKFIVDIYQSCYFVYILYISCYIAAVIGSKDLLVESYSFLSIESDHLQRKIN